MRRPFILPPGPPPDFTFHRLAGVRRGSDAAVAGRGWARGGWAGGRSSVADTAGKSAASGTSKTAAGKAAAGQPVPGTAVTAASPASGPGSATATGKAAPAGAGKVAAATGATKAGGAGAAGMSTARGASARLAGSKIAGGKIAGGKIAGSKIGGGKLAVSAAKWKILPVLLLAIPAIPLLFVLAFFVRKKKEPEWTERPRRKRNMWKLGASRAIMIVLGLASAAVAVAGLVIAYQQLKTTNVTIAAGSSKAESFIMMEALKTVVERHYPRLKLTIHESAGSQDSLERMLRGDAQMIAIQSDVQGSPLALGVAVLYQDTFQLLAHKDPASQNPPIAKFEDLKGKRIALPRSSGAYIAFLFLARHVGLTERDFTFVGGDDDSAVLAFSRFEADASFQIRSLHNPGITQLVKAGAYFVPIDDAAAIHQESPGDSAVEIPRGAYRGDPPVPPADVTTVATARLLLARNDADERAIYTITKVLMENRQEISNAIPDDQKSVGDLVGEVTQPVTRTGLAPPIHPGALSYYERERSSFLADHAEGLSLVFAAFALMWLWNSEFQRAGGEKRRERARQYNGRIVELTEQSRAAVKIAELAAVETELSEMVSAAIQDLQNGRLSDASFQSFYIVWKVATDSVRDRRLAITGTPPAAPGAGPAALPSAEGKGPWRLATLLRKTS